MYDTDIQTSISVRGHLVFIEYNVSKDWAVSWSLSAGPYFTDPENLDPTVERGLLLLELMLRTYEADRIEEILLSEFEHRQYEQEQRTTAELINEDIPF